VTQVIRRGRCQYGSVVYLYNVVGGGPDLSCSLPLLLFRRRDPFFFRGPFRQEIEASGVKVEPPAPLQQEDAVAKPAAAAAAAAAAATNAGVRKSDGWAPIKAEWVAQQAYAHRDIYFGFPVFHETHDTPPAGRETAARSSSGGVKTSAGTPRQPWALLDLWHPSRRATQTK